MKKTTLIVMTAAAFCCVTAHAQQMKMYKGVAFDKSSPNAKWLAEGNQGTLTIYDVENDKVYELPSSTNDTEMYSAGLGSSITNSGKIFGFSMTKDAFIWDNGTLSYTALPQPTGAGTSFNGAQSVTPDESRVAGALGAKGSSLYSDGMMAYPVVWTKQEDNYVITDLPYDTKDFAGATPQYIIPVAISDDGKTIAGTLKSGNGKYTIPVIYTEDANGNWTYKLAGKTEVYDESLLSELPNLPVEPKEPDATKYMSDADLARYNAALTEYEELLNMYNNGIIDTMPTAPVPGDYISDATKKAEYTAAAQEYVTKHAEYIEAYKKYETALDNITTGRVFTQNNVFLSPNGHYLAATMKDLTKSISIPGYFDLEEAEPRFVKCTTDAYTMQACGILDDGTLFAYTPVVELTRNTYVIKKGATEPQTFYDYLKERSTEAAEWLKANNSYTWTDEDNVLHTNEIVSGSVHTSGNGNVFVSYYTDYYTDANQTKKTYVIDLAAPTSINGLSNEENNSKPGFAIAGNTISSTGNTAKAEIFDMSGRKVGCATTGNAATITSAGIYIVKAIAANGEETTRKVVIK